MLHEIDTNTNARSLYSHDSLIMEGTRVILKVASPFSFDFFSRPFTWDGASSHARWWAGDEPTPPSSTTFCKLREMVPVTAGYVVFFRLSRWSRSGFSISSCCHSLLTSHLSMCIVWTRRWASFISSRLQFTAVFKRRFRNAIRRSCLSILKEGVVIKSEVAVTVINFSSKKIDLNEQAVSYIVVR